ALGVAGRASLCRAAVLVEAQGHQLSSRDARSHALRQRIRRRPQLMAARAARGRRRRDGDRLLSAKRSDRHHAAFLACALPHGSSIWQHDHHLAPVVPTAAGRALQLPRLAPPRVAWARGGSLAVTTDTRRGLAGVTRRARPVWRLKVATAALQARVYV